jgi:hypothetical protein
VLLGFKRDTLVGVEALSWIVEVVVAVARRVAMPLKVLEWKRSGIEIDTPNCTARREFSLIIKIELPPTSKKSEVG